MNQPPEIIDPWQDKGNRLRAVLMLTAAIYLAYALQDTYSFFARRQKICQDSPTHILCRISPNTAMAANKTQGPGQSHQGSGNLSVQVGSYQQKSDADGLLSRLKGLGYDGRVVRSVIPGKGTWYRVQTGRFLDRQSARKFGEQLQSQGAIKQFTVTRYEGNE